MSVNSDPSCCDALQPAVPLHSPGITAVAAHIDGPVGVAVPGAAFLARPLHGSARGLLSSQGGSSLSSGGLLSPPGTRRDAFTLWRKSWFYDWVRPSRFLSSSEDLVLDVLQLAKLYRLKGQNGWQYSPKWTNLLLKTVDPPNSSRELSIIIFWILRFNSFWCSMQWLQCLQSPKQANCLFRQRCPVLRCV